MSDGITGKKRGRRCVHLCVRRMTIEVEGRERQDAGVPTLFPQDRTIAVTL